MQCPLGQRFLGSRNADTIEHYISVLRTLTKDSQVTAAAFGMITEDNATCMISSQAMSPHKHCLMHILWHQYAPGADVPVAMPLCCAVQAFKALHTLSSLRLMFPSYRSHQRLTVSLQGFVINLSPPLYKACSTADLQTYHQRC